jgi:hypothetical protein
MLRDLFPYHFFKIPLATILCLDGNHNPVFAYHKYDTDGNLQLYVAEQVTGNIVSVYTETQISTFQVTFNPVDDILPGG